MLLKVEPPPEGAGGAELTARVYEGLEALCWHYQSYRPEHALYLRGVIDHLHEVSIAGLHLAQSIALELESLAYEYEQDPVWHDLARGWMRTARIVWERAMERAGSAAC